jgi:hypothetical protein
MERLTTDTLRYFNEVKKELTDIDVKKNQNLEFTFCEIGQLLSHGFSVSYLKGESNILKIKKWNAEFDNKRFNLNIYNLDRLAVIEKNIKLTTDEIEKIEKLIEMKLELKKIDGIILDGLFCEFKTEKYSLNWNINEEMNSEFYNLIEFLRNKASH